MSQARAARHCPASAGILGDAESQRLDRLGDRTLCASRNRAGLIVVAAMQCDECGRELTPDEPIWRYCRRHHMIERKQPVREHTTVVSVCEACRPVWYGQRWWFTDTAQAIRMLKDQNAAHRRQHGLEQLADAGLLGPHPCTVCSRPVTVEKRLLARHWDRWMCSRDCAHKAARSRRRHRLFLRLRPRRRHHPRLARAPSTVDESMIEVVIEPCTGPDDTIEYHSSLWRDGYRIEMGHKAFSNAEDCESEALEFCVKGLGRKPDKVTRL